jgi:hypothetical protein
MQRTGRHAVAALVAAGMLTAACGCTATDHPTASSSPRTGMGIATPTENTTAPARNGATPLTAATEPGKPGSLLRTHGGSAPQQPAGATSGFVPPAAGTYSYYGTDANGTSQQFKLTNGLSRSNELTKVVTTLKSADGKTNQTTTSLWAAQAIRITDIQFGNADCHWSPATTMALGPGAGKQWNIDSRCVVTAQGYTVHVHEQGTGTVQRRATATIGGQTRTGWWISTTVTITIESQTAQGHMTIVDKSRSNELLLPDAGLAATMDQHDDWSAFGKTKSTEQHLQLQSLTPA